MGKVAPEGSTWIRSATHNATCRLRQQFPIADRSIPGDVAAGCIASLVLLAYSISYAAILFQGELQSGVAQCLWALIISAAIVGIWVNLWTTLPPLGMAMDTPTMAVLVIMGSTVADQSRSAGASVGATILTVMLMLWVTGIFSSLVLWVLGHFRLAHFMRFVPYGVVGGFLAATGVLLLLAGASLAEGHRITLHNWLDLRSWPTTVRMAIAAGLACVMFILRSRIKSSFFVPAMFIGACAITDALWHQNMFPEPGEGWFLKGIEDMRGWSPLAGFAQVDQLAPTLISQFPQALATTAVVIISNLVKISGLEVTRSAAADIDTEFRINAVGNLFAALVGGLCASFIVSVSRLLTEAGGKTRLAGVVASLIMAVVAVIHVNIGALAPVPILAGLVMFLGAGLALDSLRRPFAQKAWLDLALCVGIMLICLRFGYIPGIMTGFMISCLMFAYSYSQLGLVRRHATRAAVPSNVQRSDEATAFLRGQGDAVHIYWISGYMFFGSSDRLFETVRADVEGQATPAVRFAVLDCSGLSGADASALMSLVKLKNFCNKRKIALAFGSLTDEMKTLLDRDAFFVTGSPHRAFATRNDALAWCETELLKDTPATKAASADDFPVWLAGQLGEEKDAATALAYFDHKRVAKGTEVYRQGDPAGTIDFVACGSVAIMLKGTPEAPLVRIRTMVTRTVLGEMGFFRKTARATSVIADEDSEIYTLTRSRFEQMRADDPALANRFIDFIVRTLADRVDFANKEIAALL